MGEFTACMIGVFFFIVVFAVFLDQHISFSTTDICVLFSQGPRDLGHGHGGPGFSKSFMISFVFWCRV